MGCHEEDLIRLEVPKDTINTAVCKELSIRYGILVHGPFVLEKDYELASMVVYIDFNMKHTTKPLMLHLPDWAGKGEATNVAIAPHEVDEKGQYKFVDKSLLPLATGSIPIYGHCSLFAKALQVISQKFYYAHLLESRKDTETQFSVYFTYASTVWSEVSISAQMFISLYKHTCLSTLMWTALCTMTTCFYSDCSLNGMIQGCLPFKQTHNATILVLPQAPPHYFHFNLWYVTFDRRICMCSHAPQQCMGTPK